MPDKQGRFLRGEHWRVPQPFWNKDWLVKEYTERGRSTAEIAAEFGCRDTNIQYWLAKFDIPRRSVAEARRVKHWGASGEANPMWGKSGSNNPNWRGGITADRQAFYSTEEWRTVSKQVWRRDKGICRRCKKQAHRTRQVHIHHRMSFAEQAQRATPDNLTLLCVGCHRWVHSRKNSGKEFLDAFQATLLE